MGFKEMHTKYKYIRPELVNEARAIMYWFNQSVKDSSGKIDQTKLRLALIKTMREMWPYLSVNADVELSPSIKVDNVFSNNVGYNPSNNTINVTSDAPIYHLLASLKLVKLDKTYGNSVAAMSDRVYTSRGWAHSLMYMADPTLYSKFSPSESDENIFMSQVGQAGVYKKEASANSYDNVLHGTIWGSPVPTYVVPTLVVDMEKLAKTLL